MSSRLMLWAFVAVASLPAAAAGQVKMNVTFDTPYGRNASIGRHLEINGAKIYYEEYGTGEPLLLIHGNGFSMSKRTSWSSRASDSRHFARDR